MQHICNWTISSVDSKCCFKLTFPFNTGSFTQRGERGKGGKKNLCRLFCARLGEYFHVPSSFPATISSSIFLFILLLTPLGGTVDLQ